MALLSKQQIQKTTQDERLLNNSLLYFFICFIILFVCLFFQAHMCIQLYEYFYVYI